MLIVEAGVQILINSTVYFFFEYAFFIIINATVKFFYITLIHTE
jgi:hypothetical protein